MALTDVQIRKLQPCNKQYKRFDAKGLFVLIKPNGSKLFQGKYRIDGKEKLASYGPYPEVTLKIARSKHDQTRALLRENIDPASKSNGISANKENTFGTVAEEWYTSKLPTWAEATAKKRRSLLDKDLLPWLKNLQCDTVKPIDLLKTLRRIEERGALDTAKNARQVLSEISKYAIWTQRALINPAADLQGVLKPVKTSHRPAIIDQVNSANYCST